MKKLATFTAIVALAVALGATPLFAAVVSVGTIPDPGHPTDRAPKLTFAGAAVPDLVSAPTTVVNEMNTDNTKIKVFNEEQDVTLGAVLAYDQLFTLTDLGFIPAGTKVNSHFIHFDNVGTTVGVRGVGTVTFDGPILGLITQDSTLATSETAGLGSPTTTYPTGSLTNRGLEQGLGGVGDFPGTNWTMQDLTGVSGNTLTLDLQVFNVLDQVRVITLADATEVVCVPPPTGLVSWWPGEGDANDIVGGNNGTLENGATTAAGHVGQAFSLNPTTTSDDFVQLPNTASLKGSSQFTVDAWFKPASLPATGVFEIYRECTDSTSASPQCFFRIFLGWTANGELIGGVRSGSVSPSFIMTSDPGVIVPGTFYHAALVFDDGNDQHFLYLNGAEADSSTADIGPLQNTVPFDILIGKNGGAANLQTSDGLIDEVETFNVALSQTEIESIVNAGTAGKCKEEPCFRTIGYWKNHSWDVNEITINNLPFSPIDETDGQMILSDAKSKNFSMLVAQLIAAKLNCLDGCPTEIVTLIAEAETFLDNANITAFDDAFASKSQKGGAVDLSEALDEFNNSTPCEIDCPCLANTAFSDAVFHPETWSFCAQNADWCDEATCGPDFNGLFFQTDSGFFGSWLGSVGGTLAPAACFPGPGGEPLFEIDAQKSAVCIALIREMLPASGLTCPEE